MFIDLMIVPGLGLKSVEVEDGTTVEQLVVAESLHLRGIVVDGEGIDPDNYSTTTLDGAVEVWAMGNQKGN